MERHQNKEPSFTSHPLKNHVILKLIFECLKWAGSFRDWQNIRLVCKLWHEIFLPIWRNSAILNLVRDTSILETPLEKRISASQFLAELQNPTSPYKLLSNPFRNYKFQGMRVDLRYCKPGMPAHTFWSLVGPSIRSLTLRSVCFLTTTKSVSELTQFLIREVPYLTTLKMIDVRVDDILGRQLWMNSGTTFHQYVTSFYCKNFEGFRCSMFPNLQRACFKNAREAQILNFIADSGHFDESLGSLTNSSLKHLNLMHSSIDYESVTTHLPNLNLTALERFSINLKPTLGNQPDNSLNFITIFLRNHPQTLKCLEIFSATGSLSSDHSLFSIQLPVLTDLRIWGVSISNLSFLQFTPNLTMLHMDLFGFEKQTEMKKKLEYEFFERDVVLIANDIVESTRDLGSLTGVVLEKLEYLQMNCKFSAQSISTLSGWMPNLKVFKSVLRSDNFSAVCEQWPQLKKLHCLFGSCLTDQIVTSRAIDTNEPHVKGLIDLKELTSFQYHTKCNKSALTDKSARHILRKMKRLTDLRICVSREFTEWAERSLQSHIQRVQIYRNYSENESHRNWKCCRDNAYTRFLNRYQRNVGQNALFSESEHEDNDAPYLDEEVLQLFEFGN